MMPPEIREKMERLAEENTELSNKYQACKFNLETEKMLHEISKKRISSLETALKEYGSHDYSCNLHEAQYGSPAFIAGCNCGFSKLIGEREDG
jgi:hypothetical protein